MSREDLLRKLEARLAEGEISEETYREIKARYDAMPEEPPEPAEAPEPEAGGAETLKQRPKKSGPLDISAIVGEAVDSAMEEVSRTLEATLGDEFDEHMADVGKHVQRALRQVGPTYDKGKRRVVIRSVGKVALDEPIEEFRCSGSGKVASDLIAERVRIAGACKIQGRVESVVFRASGAVKVQKDLQTEDFKSSGSAKIEGDLKAEKVEVTGVTDVGGSLEADTVRVGGMLQVDHWVRADAFQAQGRFRIGEGLEADTVKILLDGASQVPLIKGTDIVVKRSKRRGELRAKTIEGDRISVSGTRAHLVRGRDVRIGPRSRIDVVEADKVEVHETARVGERRPLPAENQPKEGSSAD